MNKKILIGSLIIILIICLIIIVINVKVKNSENTENVNETNETNQNDVSENTNVEDQEDMEDLANTNLNTTNSSNTTDSNTTDNNINYDESTIEDEDYIFYHEQETGDAQYSRDQLNNFDLNLNISDEALQYITNYDEFYITIKEYMYKQGLVDADTAEMEKYQYDQTNNRIGIVLKLNNEDEDKILAIFYLNNATTEVYNY